MSAIFDYKDVVRPFRYPWAFEIFRSHEKQHWIAETVILHQDIKDWSETLTENDKAFLTQIFRLFTQSDKDVNDSYYDNYLPIFKRPELRMMLGSFANREATHIDSYSLFIDTVGMPETIYEEFLAFSEMREKHEYALSTSPYEIDEQGNKSLNVKKLLKTIAVYGGFVEGLGLFSQFAMLLNYQRQGLMTGMCTIVEYSIKDESVHVDGLIKLFHAILEENYWAWTDELKAEIYQSARDMIDMEDKFIDLVFSKFEFRDLTADQMKTFNRYMADHRLKQLGLKANWGVETHDLEWIEYVINSIIHTNFFENRPTEYSKGGIVGNRNDVIF